MKYDFAFIYEVRNRELESLLLLKVEIEKRGYSVCIIETWEQQLSIRKPIDAEVVVSFALYNDLTLKYITTFVNKSKKFINLQWEQIYTNGDAERGSVGHDTSFGISGNALNAVHISWGKNNYEKLINAYHLNAENVVRTGNITLDFLRNEFQDYYLSKKELLSQFRIDEKKYTYLFISSFSYVNMPNNVLKSPLYQNVGFDINDFAAISVESQQKILSWFEMELKNHPDVVIIYRPHPAENNNKVLNLLENKYENFRVIGDYSVKQWIVIADKIYTWWSTSIAEIYASKKGCEILRPVRIPYKAELEIYNDCHYIETFADFDACFLDMNPSFPVPEETIRSYYEIGDKPAYIKIADVFENVFEDNCFNMEGLEELYIGNKRKKFKIVKIFVKRVLFGIKPIADLLKRLWGNKVLYNGETYNEIFTEYQYTKKMIENNYYDIRGAELIESRIKKCIAER